VACNLTRSLNATKSEICIKQDLSADLVKTELHEPVTFDELPEWAAWRKEFRTPS
jgi:hypothetical protein